MGLRRAFALLAILAAAIPALAAPSGTTPSLSDLRAQATRSRAEQLQAARDYKASLERLLVLREDDVRRAIEQRERTRALVERGMLARNDLDASERALADAHARLDQTWSEAVVAASLITKALAYEELAVGRRLAPGTEQATASLIRHQGRRAWELRLTATLGDFFRRTFNRALPVSAYGQTPVHDKLGFDHRNALDLALHPDTPEGRAVMDWLRRAGLSFIAFRGAVSGSATGAHIHVGEPSARVASP
jgi:hypothetical protein